VYDYAKFPLFSSPEGRRLILSRCDVIDSYAYVLFFFFFCISFLAARAFWSPPEAAEKNEAQPLFFFPQFPFARRHACLLNKHPPRFSLLNRISLVFPTRCVISPKPASLAEPVFPFLATPRRTVTIVSQPSFLFITLVIYILFPNDLNDSPLHDDLSCTKP